MNKSKQLQIIDWNLPRNELSLNLDLEASLLSEESSEFFDGYRFFTGQTRVVEMVDAYCDYIFVLRGTQAKVLANTFDNAQDYRNAITFVAAATQMGFMLLEVLFKVAPYVDEEDLDVCIQFVVDANAKKPIKKTGGKVEKGILWKDPKELIENYLFSKVSA